MISNIVYVFSRLILTKVTQRTNFIHKLKNFDLIKIGAPSFLQIKDNRAVYLEKFNVEYPMRILVMIDSLKLFF